MLGSGGMKHSTSTESGLNLNLFDDDRTNGQTRYSDDSKLVFFVFDLQHCEWYQQFSCITKYELPRITSSAILPT